MNKASNLISIFLLLIAFYFAMDFMRKTTYEHAFNMGKHAAKHAILTSKKLTDYEALKCEAEIE